MTKTVAPKKYQQIEDAYCAERRTNWAYERAGEAYFEAKHQYGSLLDSLTKQERDDWWRVLFAVDSPIFERMIAEREAA
jgi:hypothetical protein